MTKLRQFAQAYVKGYELHVDDKKWTVIKRDKSGSIYFCKPFPGCEQDIPKEARRLFIEVHSDVNSRRGI